MKTRNGAIAALLLLAPCRQETPDTKVSSAPDIESTARRLGTVPPSESAVWQKVGASAIPSPRYLQAAAFDSARQVVVMFGGTHPDPNINLAIPNQETWEWNITTGRWTNRTDAGSSPAARSGAAMVYDVGRAKMVLFGGRARSGLNYEDTWEWDATTGLWTDVTDAGSHPSARSQAGMVYQPTSGKILLFGGGRSDAAARDAADVAISYGDTWEMDTATHLWKECKPSKAPSARHDLGLVWDSLHRKSVLFGGLHVAASGTTGVAQQDIWEWDPAGSAWTERTGTGNKPGARYGHAMAFDGGRGKVVVFGGVDMATGADVADVLDWDPSTGAWTTLMTGAEKPMPRPRRYASLIFDDVGDRIALLAGAGLGSYGDRRYAGLVGSEEVWELDPGKPAFVDRTAAPDAPKARWGHCMAYNPATGKTYVFGGVDEATGDLLDDLWAWDGVTWAPIAADTRPLARLDSALAFDPARRSLILFGGNASSGPSIGSNDTWEWSPSRGWARLTPALSPDPLIGHGMVTDTTRGKILLFGGYSDTGDGTSNRTSERIEVWEWDGATVSWSNRTPPSPIGAPRGWWAQQMAYDSGQKKVFVYAGASNYSTKIGAYWEWDPISAGWTIHDTGDSSHSGLTFATTFDSIRRRVVFIAQGFDSDPRYVASETWELDTNSNTLFVRKEAAPAQRSSAVMAFDSARGVVVLFGGELDSGVAVNETWEYHVTGLGQGEGCTAAFAASCASGFCVDGVCCGTAACTGSCQACNVRGSEGTCVLSKAGTQVSGSCSSGQACDGNGHCMAGHGQPCTSAGACASGFCADGVCCDSACDGECVACHQTGQVGTCAPFAAGTDPQHECEKGSGICKSACSGAASCGFPQGNVYCDKCFTCDGAGTCGVLEPYCYRAVGGVGGFPGSSGGYPGGTGGTSGNATSSSASSSGDRGGAGGTVTGGSGGTSYAGTGGAMIPTGGYTQLDGGVSSKASGGTAGTGSAVGGAGGAGAATGGSRSGISGSAGTIAGSGGVAASGGSTGQTSSAAGDRRDGGDAVHPGPGGHLSRAGCTCELGRADATDAGGALPLVALALTLCVSRRRKRARQPQNLWRIIAGSRTPLRK